MSRTRPFILMSNTALAIKDLAFVFSSVNDAADKQPFIDLLDLVDENTQVPYITYEPDEWLLDGSFKFMTEDPDIGYMSLSLSDAVGDFSVAPQVQIDFSANATTDGLVLYFNAITEDYPNITISFYTVNGGSLIQEDTYAVDAAIFHTNQAVTNFRRIVFTFNSTNKPYRYARMTKVDFDESILRFTTEIQQATLTESISPISNEIPSNELTFTLFSELGEFNILAPTGFYADLQERNLIDAYEQINDNTIYLGRFYLDKWESLSNKMAEFRAVDIILILEKTPITNTSGATSISHSLLANTQTFQTNVIRLLGSNTHTFESGMIAESNPIVAGYIIDGTSKREGLQQMLFAYGAYITSCRKRLPEIRKTLLVDDILTYDHILSSAERSFTTKISLKPKIDGIEILGHTWNSDEVSTTVYSETLAAGTYLVLFNKPIFTSILTGATEIAVNRVAISFTVVTPGLVTVVSEQGTDSTVLYSEYESPLSVNPNIIRISDAECVPSAALAGKIDPQVVVARVFDYFQQRYVCKTRLYGYEITPGESVRIDTSDGQMAGIVESMITNLIGFVADVEIVGKVI